MAAHDIRSVAPPSLVALIIVALATLAACGSELTTVTCTSNADCPSNRCEAGRCVEAEAPDDTGDDEDAPGADATVDAAVDRDTEPESDTGGDVTHDVTPDASDAADADVTDAADTADVVAPDATDASDGPDALPIDASDTADASDAFDVSDAFDAPDLPDVPIDPELAPPTGLVASDGTSASLVRLTWDAVESADGFRVYRDGVAMADVEGTTWDDVTARRGMAGLVASVSASDDDPFVVNVAWSAAEAGLPGAPHTYDVATLRGDAVSEPSAPDEGFTAASPLAGYDVEVDGAINSVAAQTWRDVSAAPPTVVVGAVTAAWDGGAVQLGASGASRVPGIPRSYRVRATTEAGGIGTWSSGVSGRREAGSLEYVWQRSSADSDGSYGTITTTAVAAATDPVGPPAGEGRYYRLVLGAAGAESVATAGRRVVRPGAPVPGTPTGVQASDGTSATAVSLTWTAVADATSYDVYRDGTLLAASVADTFYGDATAAPGGAPSAPTGVTATSDRTDGVRVAWDAAAAGLPGASHRYAVAARSDGGVSALSSEDVGWRAAPAVTGYQVRVDGGAWSDVGAALTWLDADAPLGAIDPGTAVASDGEFTTHVALRVDGAAGAPGAVATYEVRAEPGGEASAPIEGRRAVGALRYGWERTAADDADATFVTLGTVTGSPAAEDAAAPVDGAGRWYRSRVQADGAVAAYTPADRGYRDVDTTVPDDISGVYELASPITLQCGEFLGSYAVNINFREIQITDTRPSIRVVSRGSGDPGAMTGEWVEDLEFIAERSIDGSCTQRYRVVGTVVDASHIDYVFAFEHLGSLCLDCLPRYEFSGRATRSP